MARCHVRCGKCDKRRVLKDHPNCLSTRGTPKCECGSKDWRVSNWMNRRNTSAHGGGMGCQCDGYVPVTATVGWPHRRGSPYCWYRKDGSQRMPGDPDFKDALLERMQYENSINQTEENTNECLV